MYEFKDAGLKDVWLANGYVIKKTPYGEAATIEDVPGLTRVICATLVKKPGRLTGAELRYLRLHLRLSQKSLAKLFGNTEQAVALWEKNGRVPLWADKLLRLLWSEKKDGNETIKRVMDRLNVIERLVSSRIVVSETKRGWKCRVEELIA